MFFIADNAYGATNVAIHVIAINLDLLFCWITLETNYISYLFYPSERLRF